MSPIEIFLFGSGGGGSDEQGETVGPQGSERFTRGTGGKQRRLWERGGVVKEEGGHGLAEAGRDREADTGVYKSTSLPVKGLADAGSGVGGNTGNKIGELSGAYLHGVEVGVSGIYGSEKDTVVGCWSL